MQLVIGDKYCSTWSMRPWLVLKRAGVAFEEVPVKLRTPGTAEEIARWSPSGRIPILIDGPVKVWDSLAICEYLADRFPAAKLWPQDVNVRAAARSVTAEMHSGFASLRGEFSMDLLAAPRVAEASEMTRDNLRRIAELWSDARRDYGQGGPFLFGDWSIADAFFTPVATRLRTYGVRLSDYGDLGPAGAYAEVLLEQPDLHEWEAGARAESAQGV